METTINIIITLLVITYWHLSTVFYRAQYDNCVKHCGVAGWTTVDCVVGIVTALLWPMFWPIFLHVVHNYESQWPSREDGF